MPILPSDLNVSSYRMRPLFAAFFAYLALASSTILLRAAEPEVSAKVGDVAPGFSLRTLDRQLVELDVLRSKSPVVMVVLRGWPGYQCPICTRQVQDYLTQVQTFRERGVKVVMVYPGPSEALEAHAREFLANKEWPADFVFALDPDYALTRAYGIRWDAKRETAYPSTFIVDSHGRIVFAHVSKSHGDRVSAARVLAELK